MRILAISGSLRAQSTNTSLLCAARLVAPAPLEVVLYEQMETLPAFNPDLDLDPGPEPVLRFRVELRSSDAVVFSTPEYAHGIPGSLKNALDWVVGSGELSEAEITVPPLGKGLGPSEIADDPEFAALIRSSLLKIAAAARGGEGAVEG